MQIIIEPKDRKEVARVARKYFGVILKPEHAEEVIRSCTTLQGELLRGGCSDTMARDYLIMAIVDLALKGVKRTVADEFLDEDPEDFEPTKDWHWPCNGSGDEYCDAFYTHFRNGVLAKGWGLDKKYWKFVTG